LPDAPREIRRARFLRAFFECDFQIARVGVSISRGAGRIDRCAVVAALVAAGAAGEVVSELAGAGAGTLAVEFVFVTGGVEPVMGGVDAAFAGLQAHLERCCSKLRSSFGSSHKRIGESLTYLFRSVALLVAQISNRNDRSLTASAS